MARKSGRTQRVTNGIGGNPDGTDDAGGDGIETVDPAAIGTGTGTGAVDPADQSASGPAEKPRVRRGWPKGKPRTAKSSGNRGKGTGEVFVTAANVARLLDTVHMLASRASGIAELRLDAVECNALAGPICDVLDHYELRLPRVYGVWGNLAVAAAAVYGPRLAPKFAMPVKTPMPDANPAPAAAEGLELMSALGGMQ